MSDDFGLGEVILSMFWFMFLVAWIWLLITILTDLFADRELSGGKKALWALFVIVVPWGGALIYIAVHGERIDTSSPQRVEKSDADLRGHVRDAAGGPSTAAELSQLAQLRASGAISDDDYELAKAKVLA